ncbi:YDG/SRA domain-containing protein [Nonomuraea sp. NPDC001831]|uniref:YDG/SRA domain-containing protein n=1 Tax=Nonomuraea sp. NPDC001831 TaxID=3364340 RepID=UPI0036751DE3
MRAMAKRFGHVKGQPVGTLYAKRADVRAAGVHAPPVNGISGNGREGADSIVVSGGYVDDEDYGDVIIYTGHGGRDPDTGRQIRDQEISDPGNAGLVRSQLSGLPVRVVRGAHKKSPHGPTAGLRYDGLFRVESHSAKIGIDGFRIWQFKLVKLSDDEISISDGALMATAMAPTAPRSTGPAPVVTTTVQRIVRNSAVVQRVKEWHEHRCQICGLAIEVNGGHYSEGAHIRALGKPHNGPDVEENVLCLCPNDHVRFDNGALYLSHDLKVIDALTGAVVGPLRLHKHHRIDLGHVGYHRACWTTGTPRL